MRAVCISAHDGVPGAAFSVEAMSFAYRADRPVFRNLSIEARPGEFLALLGPSGCGKTTLLNLLCGFLVPDAGGVRIDGAAVRPELPQLGYVFQSPQLFPWLTVLENVRFGLRMRNGSERASQLEHARHYLALVRMEHAADELPHRLSGGQRQRVALARSLALQPKLLLMDEPFSALDAITRGELNDELLRLWSDLGQTILFITHDIDEAVYLADRVLVLDLPPRGIHSALDIGLARPRDRLRTRALPLYAAHADQLRHRIADVMQPASSRDIAA